MSSSFLVRRRIWSTRRLRHTKLEEALPTSIPPEPSGWATASISAFDTNLPRRPQDQQPPGQTQASNTCLYTQTGGLKRTLELAFLSTQCRFGVINFISCPSSNRKSACVFLNHFCATFAHHSETTKKQDRLLYIALFETYA